MLNVFLVGGQEYEYVVQVSEGEYVEIFLDCVID